MCVGDCIECPAFDVCRKNAVENGFGNFFYADIEKQLRNKPKKTIKRFLKENNFLLVGGK